MSSFKRNQDKADNLLTENDRLLLYKLSKTLKELDLCEGYQRKVLFSTARYDSWFISTIPKTCRSFKDIYREIEGEVEENDRQQLLDVIELIKGGFSSDDDIESFHKYRSGLLDDEELFLFVEAFSNPMHDELAMEILGKLEERHGSGNSALVNLRSKFTKS
jgi:hypothetical protein